MATKNFLVNDSRDWQTIETIGKRLPKFDVVSSFAFLVKPVNSIDRGTLVIAAEKKKIFGKFYFIGEQQTYGLERLFASVDIVS
jgi:hypothetical protein